MPEPGTLRYTKTHEWVSLDGDVATIGITDHAQEELGDVALLQFPEVGRLLQAGDRFGEIESIKAVSDLYAPITGVVTAVNDTLDAAPEYVNNEPYDEGWILKLKVTDPSEVDSLLDKAAYDTFVEGL